MRFDDFAGMLGYWAAKAPDRPALRYARDGAAAEMTWRQLEDAVARRAEALAGGRAGCLGVLCELTPECVIEIFAAVRAGLRLVLLDANAPEALLREQAARTGVDALWGDAELTQALEDALHEPAARSGGVLFFTSGTSEAARAVMLTERSLCASAWNGGYLLPLEAEDTLLCMLPLNHVFGFVCGLLWGLSCGACVALGRGMRHYADDCGFFRPTALSAVTMLLEFLVRYNALNPELRLVLVGAGSCPEPLLNAVKARGIRVSFGYGLTETSSGVALSLGDDPYAMTVCPEVQIEIAPDGEILITAPSLVMRGYLDSPEATDAVLRDGVLYTGDLGSLDGEGRLRITGRKKEMLVLRNGTKLFLPEYEAMIARALPGRDFAVLAPEGRPVLAIRGEEGERQALIECLKPAMDDVPRGRQIQDICFMSEPLPRSAAGKIKRWELNERLVTRHDAQ